MEQPWISETPEALRALDLDALVGGAVEDVRPRVEAAGRVLEVWDDDHPTLHTFQKWPRRLNVKVRDGKVVKVSGFG